MRPLHHTKTALAALGRLKQTAKVSTLVALRVATGEPMNPTLLQESFEALGATYIKLGQLIASTPSLFPKAYVEAFTNCLDSTKATRFEVIKAIIDKELAHLGGVSAFAYIDPVPLASASIAQVHKATLKNGETVAIKVQKPNVLATIHTDLSILQAVSWVAQKSFFGLSVANLNGILKEIKQRMLCETDFIKEAEHLAQFANFLQEQHISGVKVPSVYSSHSTKKVLTMAFFDGMSLMDDRLAKKADPKEVIVKVLDTWFLSLLTTGQFHADLHAGNLMLLTDGDVGFLDFGLVGYIDPSCLYACIALMQAIEQNNPQAMAKAMIQMGMTNTASVCERELSKDLATLGNQPNEDTHALNARLLAISKRHGIHLPKDFALLAKQLLYFDRFLQTLAPTMSVFECTSLGTQLHPTKIAT